MTKKDLMNASKREFEDLKNNALYWQVKRIFTQSGYCYIIKEKSTPISCAFHFNKAVDSSEEVGKYSDIEFSLNTRQELDLNGIVEYKNLIVGILRQGNYNATMDMWHYSGNGTLGVIEDMFLISNENEILADLGVNAMPIFLKMADKYPIIPSYFEPPSKKPFIMVDIEDSNYNINSWIKYKNANEIYERKCDKIILTFINFTKTQAMNELKRIIDLSLIPDKEFGILSTPKLDNKYFYQKAFNWKSLTYKAEFDINYAIQSQSDNEQMQIKQILFNQLSAL